MRLRYQTIPGSAIYVDGLWATKIRFIIFIKTNTHHIVKVKNLFRIKSYAVPETYSHDDTPEHTKHDIHLVI